MINFNVLYTCRNAGLSSFFGAYFTLGLNMNRFEVEVEKDGKLYQATAKVEGGMLTVSSVNLGSKSASVSSNNNVLAKLLLNELIRNAG